MTDWLVYGARRGSLGWATSENLREIGHDVVTIGLSEAEDLRCDILDEETLSRILLEQRPKNVLCTVGMNVADTPFDPEFSNSFSDHMAVNAFGPLNLLSLWAQGGGAIPGSKFCAISSNSAQIARSGSASYCMSKAALSMGIRCAARALAKKNGAAVSIFAVEFGAIQGTPMTKDVKAALPPDVPLSRMPAMPDGAPVTHAAEVLTGLLLSQTFILNGTTLRMDGGEQ